jgi:threonyl-tRNA synthetase
MDKEIQDNKLYAMRHSTAHIMATAVRRLWPQAKLGVGPVIENGFYYDVDFGNDSVSQDDLAKIEKEMRKVIEEDQVFEIYELSMKDAQKWAKEAKQTYKLELLNDLNRSGTTVAKDLIPEEFGMVASGRGKITKVSFYRNGEFTDLCRGPHVASTGKVGVFKLTKVSGAYWRGNEKNPQLIRLYGVAFETEKDLKQYFTRLELAERNDHKRLGQKLEMFFFHETAPGMAYWLPKGVIVMNNLLEYWRQSQRESGYQEIVSPILNKKELYEISGHWEHYLDSMFIVNTLDNETYGLKPMNCPNAMIVYEFTSRSYKDLPLRLSDSDPIHRYELSGTLNGLLRARAFKQDDAHIFLREEQIRDEYERIFSLTERFYGLFGLDYSFRLGTRPDDFMGDPKVWETAEKELKTILNNSGRKFFVEEGDGAFYGPKIDILMKDALGRDWQMGTIQLDFHIPKNFRLSYVDENGKQKTPVVIHHVIYGAIDRFLAILIEHTAGNLPVWLAPEQIRLLTVNQEDSTVEFADTVLDKGKELGLRIEVDNSNESVGKKIRNAELMKVPYKVVIGEKEIKSGLLTPRVRKDISAGFKNDTLRVDSFLKTVKNESKSMVSKSSL